MTAHALLLSTDPGPPRLVSVHAPPARQPAHTVLSVLAHGLIILAAFLAVRPVPPAPPPPQTTLAVIFTAPAPAAPAQPALMPLSAAAVPVAVAAPPMLSAVQGVRIQVEPPRAPKGTSPARQAAPSPAAAAPAAASRAAPAATSRAGPATTSRAGPATPQPDPAMLAGLTAKISRAVQDAAIMPAAARRMRREGRVEIRFTYIDGVVDEVALAQSSQSSLLDGAALQAVRAARYPAPPAPLRGKRLPLQVWVKFVLDSGLG